jgi:hypothetical protein
MPCDSHVPSAHPFGLAVYVAPLPAGSIRRLWIVGGDSEDGSGCRSEGGDRGHGRQGSWGCSACMSDQTTDCLAKNSEIRRLTRLVFQFSFSRFDVAQASEARMCYIVG